MTKSLKCCAIYNRNFYVLQQEKRKKEKKKANTLFIITGQSGTVCFFSLNLHIYYLQFSLKQSC